METLSIEWSQHGVKLCALPRACSSTGRLCARVPRRRRRERRQDDPARPDGDRAESGPGLSPTLPRRQATSTPARRSRWMVPRQLVRLDGREMSPAREGSGSVPAAGAQAEGLGQPSGGPTIFIPSGSPVPDECLENELRLRQLGEAFEEDLHSGRGEEDEDRALWFESLRNVCGVPRGTTNQPSSACSPTMSGKRSVPWIVTRPRPASWA